MLELNSDMARRDLVPLGAAIPAPEFFPTARLNRALSRALREHPEACQTYDSVRGCEALRVQIARRLIEAGCRVTPDEIVTTPGAQSAVWLALRAVTKPGDTVIVESPTYYGLLETLESLHLRALEIGTDPVTGLCLNHLESALERDEVAAVVAVPNFGNPLGHLMTDDKKQSLVELLAKHEIPLVEDDVYGELGFVEGRPKACKAWDRNGSVLLCSSVSKTLAPGYRVGWIVPGTHQEDVERYKLAAQVATATAPQLAVADLLEGGGFDRHLRTLRRRYRELVRRVAHAVAESFPEGTRVTSPEGGHVLWVELPKSCDSTELFHRALDAGVGVAPGGLF